MLNLIEKGFENTLPEGLQWINEPEQWHFDSQGALVIAAPPIGDFFIDPAGGNTKASAPFLYTVIKGDFHIVTRVSVDMRQTYDSGCLMVMSDESNWAKLCFEFFDNEPSILSVVTRNTSDDCISGSAGTDRPYLRIARSGACFAFHYSVDGTHWKLARYFGMDIGDELKVGVVAQSPIGDGTHAAFEHLIIGTNGAGDIRVVE